jgi:hypothetical protein
MPSQQDRRKGDLPLGEQPLTTRAAHPLQSPSGITPILPLLQTVPYLPGAAPRNPEIGAAAVYNLLVLTSCIVL